MADIARLGIAVDTAGLSAGTAALNQFNKTAGTTAAAAKQVSAGMATVSQGAGAAATASNTAAAAINTTTTALGRNTAALNANATAGQKSAQIIALNRGQIQNLSYQLNDVATGLLSGQSPFQVMAQQGGQVLQVLQGANGGVGGAIKDLGGRLMGLLTPARLAAGGIAAVATTGFLAWSQWQDKIDSLTRSLNGAGRASGMTASTLASIALRSDGGLSTSERFSAAGSFAGAGLSAGITSNLINSSRRYANAFGLSNSEAIDELTKAFANPAKGAADLGQRFGVLGFEVEQQIRRAQSLGDMEGARRILMREFDAQLKLTTDTTGVLSKAMTATANVFSNAWAELGKLLSGPTIQDQIDSLESRKGRRTANAFISADQRDRRLQIIGQKQGDLQEQQALQDQAAWIAKTTIEGEKQKSYIDAANRAIGMDAESVAALTTARTASQRLAIEQERIRNQVLIDGTKAATADAEANRARTLAIADATKILQDSARRVRDEVYVGGARTPAERARRQSETEFRTLREQTDVLRSAPPSAGESAKSKIDGLATSFADRLSQMMADIPGISITSGKRSTAEQARLYAEKPGLAAPPGRSNHEYGLAADLAFATPEARAAAHEKAAEYGLRFPMSYEPWHVEPTDARARRLAAQNGQNPTVNVGGTPGLDEQQRSLNSARDRNFVEQTLFDARAATEANTRVLSANAQSFGKSTAEIAASSEKVRLQNLIIAQGIPLTEEMTKAIDKQAQSAGAYAASAEKQADAQRKLMESFDLIRDTTRDLISSPLKALARHEKPGEALKQAGLRLGDRLIDMGTNSITEMLFDKNGKGLGGWLGSILGGEKNTAMMDVKAGVVNVNGGIPGAGGGGGFLSGIFGGGGLTPGSGGLYAHGAAFSRGRVVPFASGGIANGPVHFPMAGGKTGVMGEAGAEAIMPLRRGADGKLGIAANIGRGGGGFSYHGGTTQLIVNGNVGQDTMPQIQTLLDQHAERVEASVMKHVTRNLSGIQTANASRYAG